MGLTQGTHLADLTHWFHPEPGMQWVLGVVARSKKILFFQLCPQNNTLIARSARSNDRHSVLENRNLISRKMDQMGMRSFFGHVVTVVDLRSQQWIHIHTTTMFFLEAHEVVWMLGKRPLEKPEEFKAT